MDTVTELDRLASEDSGLVQSFDHRLWCHGASDEEGSENEKRLKEGSEKRENFQQKFWGEMKWN